MSAKVTRDCQVCNKPKTKYKSQMRGKFFYCSHKCKAIHQKEIYKGSGSPSWKGGRIDEPQKGYILIRNPEHHRARKNGYVLEHIIVAEKMIGRKLKDGECIHHINNDGTDNRPENLKVHKSNGEHHRIEHSNRGHPPCFCGMPHKGHRLCTRHLRQYNLTGITWDFANEFMKPQKSGKLGRHSAHPVKICYCGEKVHARGLCNKHYRKFMYHKKMNI